MTERRHIPGGGRGRGGFTAVELMIGITITTVVMGALAAVSFAVSKSWNHQQQSQATQVTGTLSTLRISDIMRRAPFIGTVREGSLDPDAASRAAILFWARDDNGDGQIQLSEIGLIDHAAPEGGADAGTIRYYRVNFPAGWTQEQIDSANFVITPASLESASAPDVFKELAHVDHTDLARYVTGAMFYVQGRQSSRQRPTFEFVIQTDKRGAIELEYGCATLRGPVSTGD